MDGSQARNTLPFLRRSFLLGCAQNSTQPLPNHDFFSGLDGHGNEFDVVGLLAFFWVRLTFANRGHQTRIVRPEHLDHWISATQFLHAVEHTVSPGRLIPIDPQRWIAIAILGNEYVGSHARHSFHQLPDAIHAPIPFGIELVLIQTEPGLERREATDHFFLSDFHRPAHGSLPRTGRPNALQTAAPIRSCISPVVSGSRPMDLSPAPAKHAAVAPAIAPAATEVMNPDSAPANTDNPLPTARCNSRRSKQRPAAS